MKQKSIKRNVILNAIRMILSVFFPLITFPYASRMLGVDVLGTVNYTLTFVNYAALIAALGISQYAMREGAKLRDKKIKFELFTKQIFSINLITTIIAYILLALTVTVFVKLHSYWKLIAIQSLSIIFSTLSVEWINVVYEDYLYTTIRSVVTNIFTVILLFALVKKPSDYFVYASLTVLTHAVVSIANYHHCKKYVLIGITNQIDFKRHIVPILVFFANSLAISIYVNSDSTMLGWMVGSYNVGLYTSAVKIYSMVKTVLAAMYGVTISRMAFYLSTGDKENYYILCRKVLNGVISLLIPGAVALFLLSKDIILILSGNEFIDATIALQILSIGLGFAIMGGFFTTCINIPNGRESINMIASTLSAIINIILNVFLIPIYKQNGAAATTVLAEFIVCIICFVKSFDLIRKVFIRQSIRSVKDGLVGAIFIIISYILTQCLKQNIMIHFIVNVILSMTGYGLYMIFSGNDLVASYIGSIRTKFSRR